MIILPRVRTPWIDAVVVTLIIDYLRANQMRYPISSVFRLNRAKASLAKASDAYSCGPSGHGPEVCRHASPSGVRPFREGLLAFLSHQFPSVDDIDVSIPYHKTL